MQKIFMKKGSLMVFTRELPHNIYSNKSDKFRYAQYVRIVPQSELNLPMYLLEKRKKLMKNLLPKCFDTTSHISKELFML
jgi:ectoine hydroxylase-related dioxygenase (phytanoyl-CoA dioxygenase family)